LLQNVNKPISQKGKSTYFVVEVETQYLVFLENFAILCYWL